ncbi:N-acetyltransferase ESCO2-like protein, partial [Trifolium medium]|nr:N-acetyltransferase ESCO2-like protein [Trifolium medium]
AEMSADISKLKIFLLSQILIRVPDSHSLAAISYCLLSRISTSLVPFGLQFGHGDFLLRSCSTRGVEFTPRNVEDEKSRAQFHKSFTQGIQFRGWSNEIERIISSHKSGRIILVSDIG